MKKYLAHLASALLLSIVLQFGMMVHAEEEEKPLLLEEITEKEDAEDTSLLESVEETFEITPQCIPTSGEAKNVFKGYITTIIEEPIFNPRLKAITKGKNKECYEQNDGYFTCRCYRNVFSYDSDPDEKKTVRKVLPELLTVCADGVRPLIDKLSDDETKSLAPRFQCKEVQVIFSKGGTVMISGYVGMIYRWAASIVGVIAVVVMILSGIQLSLSGGDGEAVTAAKRRIVQSLAGIAVLLLSGLILYTINPTFFGK